MESVTYLDEESGYTIAKIRIYGNKLVLVIMTVTLLPKPGYRRDFSVVHRLPSLY